MKFPYVYSWKNNEKRLFLYGRTCRRPKEGEKP